MDEKMVSSSIQAATGLLSGDIGPSVDLLIQIAFSVRHCREKCKALAEEVQMVHGSLLRMAEQRSSTRFNDEELVNKLERFLIVVNDSVELVKRYEKKTFAPMLFMRSLKLQGEFESLHMRLKACQRSFGLILVVDSAISTYDIRDNTEQKLKELKQQMARGFNEMKGLMGGNQDPEDSGISDAITWGPPLFEGYMISGTLNNELPVVLVQSQEEKKEAAVLKRLSHHDTVLKFYGTCSKDGHTYLALERPSQEMLTLDDLIRRNDRNFVANWRLKRQMALEIAVSISYAHMAGVLHKNIRSPNIFLTDDWHLKVFGFFQGRIKAEPSAKKWMGVEQVRWAAPEQIPKTRPEFNEQCDIFSLGVVMWELIADDYPFSDVTSTMKLIDSRKKGKAVLSFGDEVLRGSLALQEFSGICLDCMHPEPNMRPSLEDIIRRLTLLVPEDMNQFAD